MENLNKVLIHITAVQTGEYYMARSYPDDDYNNNGKIELYEVPVYTINLKNLENTSSLISWKALRFMPYWNDPSQPSNHYKTKGWVNSGLHQLEFKPISAFIPGYSTANRDSPYKGAFRLKNSFLIHAGPLQINDAGWGAAGCVEIIGDFRVFKANICHLAGYDGNNCDKTLLDMVGNNLLYVKMDQAEVPDLKANYFNEYSVK